MGRILKFSKKISIVIFLYVHQYSSVRGVFDLSNIRILIVNSSIVF